MKLFLYNCNHLNEFLEEINTNTPQQWEGCSTTIPPSRSNIPGKSYAFNLETNAWDILIDDWRGTVLYRKSDSRIKQLGKIGPKSANYIEVPPPDKSKKYVWNQSLNAWQEYIETVQIKSVIKKYQNAIQEHIDKTAQDRGYDNGYTCASYYDDISPRYASDARIFKEWRSRVWTQVNTILNQFASNVENVNNTIPVSELSNYPSIETIISSLPVIEWEEI